MEGTPFGERLASLVLMGRQLSGFGGRFMSRRAYSEDAVVPAEWVTRGRFSRESDRAMGSELQFSELRSLTGIPEPNCSVSRSGIA